jgi:hypothetical protein
MRRRRCGRSAAPPPPRRRVAGSSPRPPRETSGPSGPWLASFVPFVDNYCRIHLGTAETAQQVVQGISRKILKTPPSYLRSRAPFWGYVYGVTARAVVDAQRYTSPEHSDPGSPVRRAARPAARRPRLRPVGGSATRDAPLRAAGSPRPASTTPTHRRRHRQDRRNVARHGTAHPTPRPQPATPRATRRIPRPALPDMIADLRPRRASVSAARASSILRELPDRG